MDNILRVEKQSPAIGTNNVGVVLTPVNNGKDLMYSPYLRGDIQGLGYNLRADINNANQSKVYSGDIKGEVLPGLVTNAGMTQANYGNGQYQQNNQRYGLSHTPEQLQALQLGIQTDKTTDKYGMNDRNISANAQYQLSKDAGIQAQYTRDPRGEYNTSIGYNQRF